MIISLLFFGLCFVVSLVTTPMVIAYSRHGVGLDHANENRKRHKAPVSRLGGLPVMLSLLVAMAAVLFLNAPQIPAWKAVLTGSVLMFGLGLWDDLHSLGAKMKLLGQVSIAVLAYVMGLGIDKVTYPHQYGLPSDFSVQLGAWSLPVTVFWLIAVPNIVNLIDGFDGVAGGLGMFLSVTLGVVGLYGGQVTMSHFAFGMAGALLGFLCFNFPPARIYLGDGGAYLIGFFIASLSLSSSNKGSIAAVLLVTVVALGVPILDTLFALARRALRGFPLFQADDEHIHHKLEDLGFSKRRIVFAIYGVCVALSLIALSIIWSQGRTIPIAIGVVFLLAIFAARYLLFVRSWEDIQSKLQRVLSRRQHVRYAIMQAQILNMEIDRCESASEFWPVFHQVLHRVGFTDVMDEDDEDYVPIHVRFDGSIPWTLHAPRAAGTRSEWHRIAECFRPVFVKAKQKWQR
jgi:UDP-GlcNAc:undecaprenyl-phosphate/decaprenyl-phosphate GlcNAc-1-phosphate transferase